MFLIVSSEAQILLGDANANLNINLHLPGTLSVIKIIHGEVNKVIKMQMSKALPWALGSWPDLCQGLTFQRDPQQREEPGLWRRKSLMPQRQYIGRNKSKIPNVTAVTMPGTPWSSVFSQHSVLMAQITDNFSTNQTITAAARTFLSFVEE